MAAKTIEDYSKDYFAAKAAGDSAGMQAANDAANAIRASQGQAAQYANEDIANVKAASSKNTAPSYLTSSQQIQNAVQTGRDAAYEASIKKPVAPIANVDTSGLNDMLAQIVDLQKQQSGQAIDFATNRSAIELQRAMEDAAGQYQTQRNQVSADEQRALDNQALYSELRGDKGGIGQAQYGAIQNTAAVNRLAVNREQTKLSTDTARQISDLRAQGEFAKADALLEITQSYLSNLLSLEQWAIQTNLSVDEFNAQLAQWENEYNLSVKKYMSDLELSTAQLTGKFTDGRTTLQAQETLNSRLASAGETLLSLGIMPSDSQLKAMGMDQGQAQDALTAIALQQAAKGKGGGDGTVTDKGSAALYAAAYADAGDNIDAAESFIIANAKKYGLDPETAFNGYQTWLTGRMQDERDEEIAVLAKAFLGSYPGARLDSPDVTKAISANRLTGADAATFRRYLAEFGAAGTGGR